MAVVRVHFSHDGDFSNTIRYFKKLRESIKLKILDHYGRKGVELLMAATPKDTGLTSLSWYYEIYNGEEMAKITFYNANYNKGVPIAVILQYGHGTGTGGWVEGRDYINPAIQPLFDEITNKLWKEVTSL